MWITDETWIFPKDYIEGTESLYNYTWIKYFDYDRISLLLAW